MRKSKLAPIPKNAKKAQKYYGVMYKGKLNMFLNPFLAIKQKITVGDLETLKELHVERLELFDEMEAEKDVKILSKQVKKLQKLEFAMQKAWGFEQDAKFHSWWFKVPQCLCPKMDNEDMLGTGYNVFSDSCPLHGKKADELMKVIRK